MSSSRPVRCRAVTPTDEVEEAVNSTGLEYGLACAQGPRDTMEDELCIIPELDGYLYAGTFLLCGTCAGLNPSFSEHGSVNCTRVAA